MSQTIFKGTEQEYELINILQRKDKKRKVYIVKGLKDQKQYCMKIFNKKRFATQQKLLEIIKNQFSADQNILQIKEWFDYDLNIYLILEYCEGGDVEIMIENGELNMDIIKQIVLQVGYQLDKFHQAGFFFFGLKPENIVAKKSLNNQEDQSYFFKLCDFKSSTNSYQLQNLAEDEDWTRTAHQVSLAPEFIKNEKHANLEVDIWSFGLTIIEIMAQKKLFEGGNEFQIQEKVSSYAENTIGINQMIDSFSKIDENIKIFLKTMINPKIELRPPISKVNSFFKQYFSQKSTSSQPQSKYEEQQLIIKQQQSQIDNILKENARLKEENSDLKIKNVSQTQGLSNTAPLLGNVHQNKDRYSFCELCPIIKKFRSQLQAQQHENQLGVDSDLEQTQKFKKNTSITLEFNKLIGKKMQEIQTFIEQTQL